jgi:DNA-nicking Smr family endonuclease
VKRRGKLSAEELALWAHVAQSVRPLPGRLMPKIEAPATLTQVPPGFSVGSAQVPAPAARIKPLVPLERRMRQRVSRGQSPIDGVLDLHGMRQDEAHRALLNFIYRKSHEGAAMVMIVTGKGGSGEGVLKRMTPHWLSDPGQRRYVLGFEDAAQHHGGSGALYVRLRRLRETA